jgi:cell shape-determining protein MreC
MPKHDIGELITALNDAVNKLNNLRTKYDDLEKENARLREVLGELLRCTEKHVFGDECKAQRDNARAALGETQ